MERISVFDIFKIGIGPSSSHTMGPWKAAQQFINELKLAGNLESIERIQVELFGSLAKTGKGHGTDIAIILGLQGEDPATIPLDDVQIKLDYVQQHLRLPLNPKYAIPFNPDQDILFYYDQILAFHSNGLRFRAFFKNETAQSFTYFSTGGGFVVKEGDEKLLAAIQMPYPIDKAEDLENYCNLLKLPISAVVLQNELALRTESEIRQKLLGLWDVMKQCIFKACHTDGVLPGGLNVQRRAQGMASKLMQSSNYSNVDAWMQIIKSSKHTFTSTLNWLSCFALAVNEENAAFGRIVTAPTNGAAGVIPAVLMYQLCFTEKDTDDDIIRFLLTAGEMGSLFKKGATISAAMGGCQAEIGVSSAMAAAALTECQGGSFEQAMMAAEIAMEHHLGLTCDPIGGLVQIPCIERNTMGAIKAVTASQIAMESDPSKALVSLDAVIKTMKETAKDMNSKYKETSDGGLAIHIPVNIVEC
ncbi:MAG: L-serine ammonia-lyase [Saprospiraceae bacterium]